MINDLSFDEMNDNNNDFTTATKYLDENEKRNVLFGCYHDFGFSVHNFHVSLKRQP